MAHSLTQHRGSTPSLPFPTGVRPNPLGFSFGNASFGSSPGPSSFSQNPAFPFPKPAQQSPIGFGFGGGQGAGTGAGVGAGPGSGPEHGPGVSTSAHVSPLKHGSSSRPPASPPSKKKRSRRSSASSTSSSPATGWATLPSPRGSRLDLAGLEDAEKRRVIKKNMKRVRQDTERQGTDNVDLGVLLATLPPTAHLPILLHLIKRDPSLEATVMSQLPQPDLSECLTALDRCMDKCRKSLGVSVQVQVDAQRRWNRALPEIEAFMRMANTYVSFFASTQTDTPSDPHVIHQLLHTLTRDIFFLLAYVPPEAPTEETPTKTLLDLAKKLLAQWNAWLLNLSREVNQNGSMYPHPMVTQWADGLDMIIGARPPAWPTFGKDQGGDGHLVGSFRQAFGPIRGKFYAELGWVIGRTLMQ